MITHVQVSREPGSLSGSLEMEILDHMVTLFKFLMNEGYGF